MKASEKDSEKSISWQNSADGHVHTCVRVDRGVHTYIHTYVVASDARALFQGLHLANELRNIPSEIGRSRVFNEWLVI